MNARLRTLLALSAPLCVWSQALTPVWVETGENGQAIARVVVNQAADCGALLIDVDGASQMMTLRTPVPDGLKPACELALPAGARRATAKTSNGTQTLPVPHPDPAHVVVLGDTGCRIKGARVQDCNDPAHWPFAQVAGGAAASKPDLVIHVGDYLYREDPCPAGKQKECGGVSGAAAPAGDNWNAWNADFFAPAAKLLAAAPWAVARGNHEDCRRSWRGWFYYLDPRPWPLSQSTTPGCLTYSPPYLVKLGKFELLMLDSAAVNENVADPAQVSEFAAQLGSLAPSNAWLVDHHPFWGFRTDENGGQAAPAPISAPLSAAWDRAFPGGRPSGITMILSGHVHLFELLNFDTRPPQLVAGDGGTMLAGALPQSLDGIAVEGGAMVSGQSRHEFGYTVLRRSGSKWKLSLTNAQGHTLAACTIDKQHAACP
jgi:hypothetical protein